MTRAAIRAASRVFLAILACALAACAAPRAGEGPTVPAPISRPATPRQVFLAKCSRCHAPEIAYRSMGRRDQWVKAVANMAAKDFRWIDNDAMRSIIAYYDDHPAVVSTLFSLKCGPCHQWGNLRGLDKNQAQWKTMLTFMGRRSSGGLSQEELEMLLYALTGR